MSFSDQISKAKKFPINEIYPFELRRIGNVLRGKCPFHKDNQNPNFTLYPETNSYYCYKCQFGGDVIDLYMKIKEVDFKKAVKTLSK